MRSFWVILGRHRTKYLQLLAASALLSATEALLHPLMLKWLFDEAILVQDFARFLRLALAYLGLGLAMVGLFYVLSLWQKALFNRVVSDLEGWLLERSLGLDWGSFSRQGAGAFVSRIHRDTLEGVFPLLRLVLAVAQQGLATLAFLGVLLYLSWQATLVSCSWFHPFCGWHSASGRASGRAPPRSGRRRPATSGPSPRPYRPSGPCGAWPVCVPRPWPSTGRPWALTSTAPTATTV